MIKAIIFDFDGVIVDTENNKFKDLKKILKDDNLILEESDFKDMVGKKTKAVLSLKFPSMKSEKKEEVIKLRRQMQLSNKNIKLVPGIKELLDIIKSKKIQIAITTGSSKALVEKMLKDKDIKSFFDLIVSGEDFEESKPSPECYEVTLKKLGFKSSEVIVIEDSIAGIKAAKQANCKVWAIMTYLSKEELREADTIFKSHLDILDYLKKS